MVARVATARILAAPSSVGSASREKSWANAAPMALRFIGVGPDTDGDHCPAMFIDDETGDFLLQGWTVTDPDTLAAVAGYSLIRGPRVDSQAPGQDAGHHLGGG